MDTTEQIEKIIIIFREILKEIDKITSETPDKIWNPKEV